MQHYIDSVIGRGGAAISGASVLVKTYPGGVKATLYSDNGSTLTDNPLTTDDNGQFSFYAADGRYSFTITKTDVITRTVSDVLLEDPSDGSSALAASGGAALIGFLPSGSGLSATTTALQLQKSEFFESISALKAWSGPTNKTLAFVRGYYAAGDGGGGIYYYDSSSSATDNGGTIIIPTAAPATGRWRRQYDANQYSIRVFGAKGDGSTDDFDAIDAAIDAVAALVVATSTGGVVLAPAGEYVVTEQIVIPSKVRIKGDGKRATVIQAHSTFPTSTALVRLGNGTSFAFDCRVEDMTLDCASISGSVGIYSTDANEGSGARNVLVTAYMSRGVDIDDSGASNFNDHFLFDEVEIYCAATATNSVGFRYNGLKQGGQIRRMTVNNNGITTQTAGVQLLGTGASGSHVEIVGLNVERHADALLIDTNAGATASSVTLLTAGTNTVHIVGALPVMLTGIVKGAATNAIKNDVITQNITDSRVPLYITSLSGNGYQAYTAAGRSVNDGAVVSNDAPVWTVKSLATSAGASLPSIQLLDGNNDGWKLRFGGTLSGDPLQFLPVNTGTPGSSVFSLYESGAIQALPTTNGPVGTATLAAGAASTVVSNTIVTASSLIFLFPTSANAAADVAAGNVYISAKSAGASFTITHPNNANADKTFNYLILN